MIWSAVTLLPLKGVVLIVVLSFLLFNVSNKLSNIKYIFLFNFREPNVLQWRVYLQIKRGRMHSIELDLRRN